MVGSDWIKRTESALNLIIKTDADILLGNPDRISPEPPFNFTVTLILDSLLNLSDVLQKKKLSKEFGKPNLSRKMIKVKKEYTRILEFHLSQMQKAKFDFFLMISNQRLIMLKV